MAQSKRTRSNHVGDDRPVGGMRPSSRRARVRAAAFVAALLVPPLVASSAHAAADVHVDGPRITARFAAEPLQSAVEQVARALGAEVVGTVENSEPITLELDEPGVDEALRRMMGRRSFALTYDRDGRLRTISFQAASTRNAEAAPEPTRVAPPAPPAPPVPRGPLIPREVLTAAVRLDRDSDLWALLATPSPTIGEMLRIGMVSDDVGVRHEALAAGVAAIDADPSLQTQVAAALSAFDDAQIDAIRRMGKQDVTLDIMQALAVSVEPALRARAADISERLHRD